MKTYPQEYCTKPRFKYLAIKNVGTGLGIPSYFSILLIHQYFPIFYCYTGCPENNFWLELKTASITICQTEHPLYQVKHGKAIKFALKRNIISPYLKH